MTGIPLTAGFIALTDAGPLIVARELGFAEEEGLELKLSRQPSWSALRDQLAFGQVQAAHLLSPLPVAMTLGLGGLGSAVDVVQVMSIGGMIIGVSTALGLRLREGGHDFGFDDAYAAGRQLIAVTGGALRIGVPFPFSMHAELVHYWLEALGPLPPGLVIRTVPPPQMAEAMAAGEIDAFCVGEPWGSIAVETGVGQLLLPGSAIWSFAPDKVLAMRHDVVEAEPDMTARLMRALWKGGRWLAEPGNIIAAAELLARPEYVGVPRAVIERALTQHIVTMPGGEPRPVPQFQEFFAGLAPFPWRSQGEWIGARLARRYGLDAEHAREVGKAVFRSDLYRANLGRVGALQPGASAKVEGALEADLALPTRQGTMILSRSRFFDGAIFDPDRS
ncbi:nitrate transporter [Haematobacter massiliensis]|uniref:Nitrate transporter n=1 Tax=Haematobacter massiliensis TaxID=195105 RepID=A0A086Y207_9RHOB|nr:ABC transporter substrate-binding protein [Haematobacter massiliensis]KFI28307.1 nitrate transporter [Haematobacter massiliensis]OWJ84443.1 nitrate transporter [Haematobacter massiliensis]QBJ26411.1 ABC transporter substrate-binding protein [Haematobacter massiliensis]